MNNFLSSNKAGLCIGGGLACMIMGMIFEAKFSPEASKAIDRRKEELMVDKLTPIETIRTTIVYHLPTIASGALGAGLILGGNQMNLNHEAATLAAYAFTDATLQTTREKIKEIVGEKKAKDIEEAVAKDAVQRNPIENSTVLVTGDGDHLCYDTLTNQYFRSSINKIEKSINDINFMLRNDIVTLNNYCLRLGINEVPLGNDLAWDINRGGYIDVYFTAVIAKNGEPCIEISHRVAPRSI